jgi:hypothetical protein
MGSGTFLRDPDLIWPKSFGSDRIRTTKLLVNYEQFKNIINFPHWVVKNQIPVTLSL